MPSIFVWCSWSWSIASVIHAAVVLFSTSSCYVPLLYVLPCLMPGKILQDRPGPSKTLAALWKCWQRSKSSPLTSHLSKTKLEVQISSGMQDLNLCLWHSLCLEGAKGFPLSKKNPASFFTPKNLSKSRRCLRFFGGRCFPYSNSSFKSLRRRLWRNSWA